ncbi:MAG: hypothetical protein H2174_03355 [Vampirovibrio sp.]|nr:hypothetical protein [Vampirovibrio sp.]
MMLPSSSVYPLNPSYPVFGQYMRPETLPKETSLLTLAPKDNRSIENNNTTPINVLQASVFKKELPPASPITTSPTTTSEKKPDNVKPPEKKQGSSIALIIVGLVAALGVGCLFFQKKPSTSLPECSERKFTY